MNNYILYNLPYKLLTKKLLNYSSIDLYVFITNLNITCINLLQYYYTIKNCTNIILRNEQLYFV